MENIKTQVPKTIEYTDSEVLNYLLKECSIDVGDVAQAMKKKDILQLLTEVHPYKITQCKDGNWKTHVKDESKKDGRRTIAKPTLDQLQEVLYDFYTGQYQDVKKKYKFATVKTLYPEWFEYKSLHTTAETTMIRIDSVWRNYYLGKCELLDTPIRTLTKLDMDKWAHGIIKEYETTKTNYYNITMIMRQVLDYAVDLEIIQNNPLDKIKVDGARLFKKVRKGKSEDEVFNNGEIAIIIEQAWVDYYSRYYPVHQLTPLAMLFQFQTGLRISEVVALRYEDIKGSIIEVKRMLRYRTNEVVDHTKGTFGDREVILTDTALEIIAAAQKRQEETEGVSSNGYIFSMTDEPLSYYALRKIYDRYCKLIGTSHKSSHKARKTFISALIDGGVNINTIRELVGHNDERTTYRNYCFDRCAPNEKKHQIETSLSFAR